MSVDSLPQPRCPLCAGPGRLWTRRPGRELWRCRRCRFAWVPQGVMRGASGGSIYEDEASFFMSDEQREYYRDESTIDAARDKLRWIVAHSRGSGRLLDVGANFGYFVREAAACFDASGIEPNAAVVEWGRAHVGAPLAVGSVYDDRPELRGRLDVVTMFDVLEHLPDPKDALERCRALLAPGGRLFITTPDTGSVMARLLGRHWYYIDLVEHIAMFDRANLGRLLRESGFSVVSVRTMGRRYKLSYIERRLGQLAGDAPLLRVAHAAAKALRVAGERRVPLNLRDVMGVVAAPAGAP